MPLRRSLLPGGPFTPLMPRRPHAALSLKSRWHRYTANATSIPRHSESYLDSITLGFLPMVFSIFLFFCKGNDPPVPVRAVTASLIAAGAGAAAWIGAGPDPSCGCPGLRSSLRSQGRLPRPGHADETIQTDRR